MVMRAGTSNQKTGRSWIRFIFIFAALLAVVEILLRGNAELHAHAILYFGRLGVSDISIEIITALSNAFITFLILISLFIMIEWGGRGRLSIRSKYADGIIYSSIALTFSVFIQGIEFYLFQYWNIKPLFGKEQLRTFLFVVPLVYLFTLGFMEYWLHRALHHYEFLWRFHSIHHQIKHLNAAQSYSHFGEIFLYLLLITTPLILLIDVPQGHIAMVTSFYIVSNYYMHSDSPMLSFPAPLRHIFADNIYHHYHHSTDSRHFGKNYASFISIYDRIFGTQYMPETEDFPKTGIDGYRPIDSVADYIKRPFIKYIDR